MKVFTSILVIFVTVICSGCASEDSVPLHTAYGYLKNIAIPEAKRIRKAEEAYHSQHRIVGGTPASPGQHPYQAGLILSITNLTDVGVCGGTVLSEDRVLTAAHCWFDGVHQAWKVNVILGSVSLYSGGVRIESNLVVVDPKWKPLIVRNDIAMIYLPHSVKFSEYIAPISLPSGDELNEDFVGSTAIASGFGLTNDDAAISNGLELNHVPLMVIDNNICRFAFPLLIHPTNVCTIGMGIGGGSACRGDSGGPLVLQRNGRSILVGITSFGSTLGCHAGLPDVYTRVSSFITFIKKNM